MAEDSRCKSAIQLFVVVLYSILTLDSSYGSQSHDQQHSVSVSRLEPQDWSIAFGGVLDSWINLIPLNDTSSRQAVRFAIKQTRRRWPDTFPLRTELDFTHQVKNMKKMKVVYTTDGQTAAMFSMLDPILRRPTLVSLTWGLIYTFYIELYVASYPYTLRHYFTVLEYLDERLYLLEHSLNCQANPKYEQSSGTNARHFHHICTSYLESVSTCTPNELARSGSCDTEDCDSETGHLFLAPGVSRAKFIFTILSFNIWNTNVVQGGATEYIRRIMHLAQMVRSVHPDFVAFQEVRFEDGKGGSLGPNQLHHLSRLLPDYQFVYQPGQVQIHGIPDLIVEGVAIFSRHKISHRHHILLSRDPSDVADGHQRVLLHAECQLPVVGKVHLLNTHLSLSHEARLRTVTEIWDYASKLPGPVFLAGDFNAEAHNEEVQFLAGKQQIGGRSTSGFHDVWELYKGPHNKGFSFNTLEEQLSKRIDLLFMSKVDDLGLISVELLDDGTRGLEAASDHLGLLATFAAPPLHH